MGDRVSISFRKKEETYGGPTEKKTRLEESPALFHHWGGTELPKVAFEWFKKVKAETKAMGRRSDPFTRLEPRNLMVQLIGTLAREKWDQYTTGLTKDNKACTWVRMVMTATTQTTVITRSTWMIANCTTIKESQ